MGHFATVLVAIASLGIFVPTSVHAAPLVPTKPSQVVTARCYSLTHSCMLDGSAEMSVGGNAPTTGFSIPAGKVFVVTSVNATTCGVGGYGGVQFYAGGQEFLELVGELGAAGCASFSKDFTTGVIARTGVLFFGGSDQTLMEGLVNGFFTTDK